MVFPWIIGTAEAPRVQTSMSEDLCRVQGAKYGEGCFAYEIENVVVGGAPTAKPKGYA